MNAVLEILPNSSKRSMEISLSSQVVGGENGVGEVPRLSVELTSVLIRLLNNKVNVYIYIHIYIFHVILLRSLKKSKLLNLL